MVEYIYYLCLFIRKRKEFEFYDHVIGEDVDDRLQFLAKISGRNREEFTVDIADMLTFWNSLVIGNVAVLHCFSEEQEHVQYRAIFQYDMENKKVVISYERLKDGKAVAGYDQDKNQWIDVEQMNIPEKFMKIFDSQSPEADILQLLLEHDHQLTHRQYQSIKSKYRKLFTLYNATDRYMVPFIKDGTDGSIKLYLGPRDVFRHGFSVTQRKDELVLMQDLCQDDLDLMGLYDVNRIAAYEKVVGQTEDVKKMKNYLYRLANRYTEDDIFTVPASLEKYLEVRNLRTFSRSLKRNRERFNDDEVKNLESFCGCVRYMFKKH